MITIDGLTGRVVYDAPTLSQSLETEWCYTAHCGVCLKRTNTAYKVWIPSTNQLRPPTLYPIYLPGHSECYSLLAEQYVLQREQSSQWAYIG